MRHLSHRIVVLSHRMVPILHYPFEELHSMNIYTEGQHPELPKTGERNKARVWLWWSCWFCELTFHQNGGKKYFQETAL